MNSPSWSIDLIMFLFQLSQISVKEFQVFLHLDFLNELIHLNGHHFKVIIDEVVGVQEILNLGKDGGGDEGKKVRHLING